jgi:hypothetical protein
MPKNDVTTCDHDFEPSLTEAGVEVCAWCPATREAAPSTADASASIAVLVVEEQRAA